MQTVIVCPSALQQPQRLARAAVTGSASGPGAATDGTATGIDPVGGEAPGASKLIVAPAAAAATGTTVTAALAAPGAAHRDGRGRGTASPRESRSERERARACVCARGYTATSWSESESACSTAPPCVPTTRTRRRPSIRMSPRRTPPGARHRRRHGDQAAGGACRHTRRGTRPQAGLFSTKHRGTSRSAAGQNAEFARRFATQSPARQTPQLREFWEIDLDPWMVGKQETVGV